MPKLRRVLVSKGYSDVDLAPSSLVPSLTNIMICRDTSFRLVKPRVLTRFTNVIVESYSYLNSMAFDTTYTNILEPDKDTSFRLVKEVSYG